MSFTPTVPPATGGEISDEILERACIPAYEALADGSMTLEQGALIQMTGGPLMRELLQWRRRAALIRDLAQPDNVIMMRAG